MLTAIIDWSLRHRFVVVAAALIFVAASAAALPNLAIDAFPDTTPVQVQINTAVPGLAPGDVERQVSMPVEHAISGLPHLEELRSVSKFGLSQVVATFEDGTDIYFARQQVAERLTIAELPEGYPRPRMGPVATGLGEVFHYIVRGQHRSLTELRTSQDWSLKPALRTVPGVAEINGWGGLEKRYEVHLDPVHLHEYDVSFEQVLKALRDNNLNVGGGYLPRSGETLPIQGVGRTMTIKAIRDIVVTTPRPGIAIRIGDVAEVVEGAEVRMGSVTAQGRGEVVLGLGFMLMGENSHTVASRLHEKLDESKKSLPAGTVVETVYDRTQLVDQVLDTVRSNLFDGGLLVIAVLFVFLGNLRAGLIVASAIPISMLFAFTGMMRFGIAGSLLSLGAIDFGLVVDSSLVMVENVVRRLSHERDSGRDKLAIIRDAALEVRAPTMFGELIIMIVYLPILTLEGVEGKLFRPMALTVVFALAGSMVLSLTLMPVLSSLLLPRKLDERDPLIVRIARWFYAPLLRLSLRNSALVLGVTAVLVVVGVLVGRGIESAFVPKLSEGALVATVFRPPGTSMEEAMRRNTEMERMLLKEFPNEVQFVWSRCGTAEVATDPMGPEETDFFITLKPRSRWRAEIPTQDVLTDEIEKLFKDIPGQSFRMYQPIEQRVNEMIAGSKADVVVKVFGDDFEVLRAKAAAIEAVLKEVPGAKNVSVEQTSGQPTVEVRVKPQQLARYNVSARTVFDLVESLAGKPVGDITEGQLHFPLAVRLPEHYKRDVASMRMIPIETSSGMHVTLGRLADVEEVEGPAKIQREAGRRRLAVECNVRGRPLGGFIEEARREVEEKVKLPEGRYHLEWGGQFENLERARTRLYLVVPLALLLIFTLLYVTYHRLADVLLVFTAVPVAAVGGVLALWVRELPFSISAAVGFIALSGVSVLNNMVLVTFIRQLRQSGVSLSDAVEQAALTRLRPVLMTALVASLGFVPMALSTGVGAEVQRPLATVVIGGVITSTLLTLFVLPVLYRVFGPRQHFHAAEVPGEA